VERIEPKQLLSSSVIGGLARTPVLTMGTYSSTLAGVKNALGTVAKTQKFSGLAASLARLSARLPYGRQQLLPVWKNDLNIFDANIRGSALAMQQKLLSDTKAFVQNGATKGLFRVSGRVTKAPPTPTALRPLRPRSLGVRSPPPSQLPVTAILPTPP
jgi:hypothetical protein